MTYQRDRLGINGQGNGGKLSSTALVGLQIWHGVFCTWKKHEKMENVIRCNMSKMWIKEEDKAHVIKCQHPTAETHGSITNCPTKWDAHIKNRVDGKDYYIIKVKELEEGCTWD